MSTAQPRGPVLGPDAEPLPAAGDPAAADNPRPWELIDPVSGRYMPRRIRGSFRGRALG